MKRQQVETALRQELGRMLEDPGEIDGQRSLSELGIDSLGYCQVSAFIEKRFAVSIRPEALFELSSIDDTVTQIVALGGGEGEGAKDVVKDEDEVQERGARCSGPGAAGAEGDVAIVGLALNFPGAGSAQGYWELIRGGGSVIREFPGERDPRSDAGDAGFLKGGFVDDVAGFDPGFFGISPREATAMDPQQRLLLECVWHALEDAGYAKGRLAGSNTGVFVGASSFDYFELLLRTQAARTTHIGTGLSHAILANRISQFWDLKGASEAIDTACSSALVALWRAVETLRRGQSEMALVGAVNVLGTRTPFQIFADAGMLSPAGACLPFDDRAAGYVRGEGAACLVVKRAADALRDGDRIWAVIKGGAVRHSGHTNSLTAPNPDAQANVIVAAFEDAGVDPGSIGYLEAHGTGTALGDPIEINGLKRASARLHAGRGRQAAPPRFAIGSVKAQIGHLEAAAGLAGLIKVVLALAHRWVPGSPHLTRLNPHIDLADAPFAIPMEGHPWEGPEPRRAGVSGFGFGGVNAHLVLEEAPPLPVRRAPPGARLFLLSARTEKDLAALAAALADHVAARPFADQEQEQEEQEQEQEQAYLSNVAFTLTRRTPLAHRLAVVASSAAELAAKLRQPQADSPGVFTGVTQRGTHEVADLFADPGELEERLRALAGGGQWHKIAPLWVKGLPVAWDRIAPGLAGTVVTLPGYPFAHERFWPRFSSDSSAASIAAVSAVSAVSAAMPESRPGFYVSRWEERPLPGERRSPPEGTLVALVAGERGRRVAESLQQTRHLPVLVLPQTAGPELTAHPTPVAGLLDLTALEEEIPRSSEEVCRKLEWVSQLVGGALKRGERVDVLQATLGLARVSAQEAPSTLAGAQESGLYACLWAEYRSCRSRTVDFDPRGFDPAAAAATILDELELEDAASELAYRGGRRLARVMTAVAVGRPPADAGPAGSDVPGGAVITGGTGEIGGWLLRDLVARGFRALLLTGRRALSADQRRRFAELGREGVTVVHFQGELGDRRALGQAIEAFRAQHGPISHVYHCAGAVDRQRPAFFQKTAASMSAVLQPKVDALWVLHELFASAPPRQFVLFSSISARAPKLAAGVLDYAAANQFLDHFAEYQHGQGHTQYRSVQWTRWRDTGLGRDPHAGSPGAALVPAQCLEALARLSADADLPPSICVAALGDPGLAPAARERAPLSEARRRATAPLVSPAPRVEGQMPSALSLPGGQLDEVRQAIRGMVARELEMAEERLDDEASFEALGIDSIVLIGLVTRLEQWLGLKVDPSELIKCDSISKVAGLVAARAPATTPTPTPVSAAAAPVPSSPSAPPAAYPAAPAPTRSEGRFPVAVIGIACRFPGAADRLAFWRNLADGVDSIGLVPASRWDAQALYCSRPLPGKTVSQWGGFIDGVELIEPALFGLDAEQAADVDPLIRLFTECSMEALDDSGHQRSALRGRRVGVFAGARGTRYAERIGAPGKHSVTGVGQNFIAAYASHLLDLRGPSLVLDSACSSSLAAVHLACQSLSSGDSELAIAGGVDLLLDEKPYLFLSAAHALSPDGRCRTFDERANGFVPGEGVGCVVLKPLARALADGDAIYAVIEGSAMNNDGHTLGITTPGVEGQVDVIERALAHAAVAPREISYVETHGTGTMIGDPIELRALARAFAKDPPRRCGLGSVKTNVGHLLSAAGIASFIKVALSLHHRILPPTLHCDRINPRFEFERSPFFPVRQAEAWDPDGGPRRAGVSAFGFGKTNVHAILSQRPEGARPPAERAAAEPDRRHKVRAWHPRLPEQPAPLPGLTAGGGLLALEDLTVEESMGEA